MARNIALTVRVTEAEADFLEVLAAASFHGKTTVAYMGVREYLDCHGFKAWLSEREASLAKANKNRRC